MVLEARMLKEGWHLVRTLLLYHPMVMLKVMLRERERESVLKNIVLF
jgi:hypothetical protein